MMTKLDKETLRSQPGFFPTVGVGMLGSWLIVCAGLSIRSANEILPPQLVEFLVASGLFGDAAFWLAAYVLVALAAVWVLIGSFASAQSIRLRDYMSFRAVSTEALAFWIAILLIVDGVEYLVVEALSGAALTAPWCQTYLNSQSKVLLLIAFLIAPAFEEPLYRGVLLRGLQTTQQIAVGVLLSSTLFAVTHYGDGLYAVFSLFLSGLIYGLAAIRTKSIVTTLCMHVAHNLLSFTFLAYNCSNG